MAALPCGICNEKATRVEEKCLNYFEDPNKKLYCICGHLVNQHAPVALPQQGMRLGFLFEYYVSRY